MLLKKSLCAMIVLTLLLFFPSLATERSEITNIIPSYTVSQEFIDFTSPVFLSPNLGHKVIDNETLTDVTADFLADTEKYYSKNDWTSIHYYLAKNAYTIIRCDNSSVQPYSTEIVQQVSGWPILVARSGSAHPNCDVRYNVEAKISGSFSFNTNTNTITNVTSANVADFRYYPTVTNLDETVTLENLSPFSSYTRYIATFGCNFRLKCTTNASPEYFYLVNESESPFLTLQVQGGP